MRTWIACLTLLIFSHLHLDAQVSGRIEANELEHLPAYWPYRVQLSQPLPVPDDSGKELPAYLAGILIRVEGTTAIVDFGRFGLYPVPFEATNILNQANALFQGKLIKDRPNYGNMVAPRLIESDPENKGKWRKFPSEAALVTRGFAFVYLCAYDQLEAALDAVSEVAGGHLEDTAIIILVPLFAGHHEDIQAAIDSRGAPYRLFVEHLRAGYIHALHHLPLDGQNTVVVTDLEGKIHSRSSGLDLKGLSSLPRR